MDPDPVAVLELFGFGKHASGIVALVMCVGYVVAKAAPWLPAASVGSSTWWRMLRGAIDFVAGNYRNAGRTGRAAKSPPVV